MKGMINNLFYSLKARMMSSRGNILIYIVLTMVIFGVLGVTMVSLFSTAISSSATQNDTRRATYLSEAGTRYAMSELLNGGFSEATIDDLNDNTDYTLSSTGKFKINVFSPWFEPDSNIDIGSNFSDQTRTFDIQEGNLPNGFINRLPTSASGLALVNYNYINGALNPPPSAIAIVTGSAEVGGDPLKLRLTLDDDSDGGGFVANVNETISFAVKPFSDASLPGNIFLLPAALKVFPARNGSIEIKKRNFYYEQAIDQATYVELTNVKPVKDESVSPLSVLASDDYVILNPRNRYIISEGHSGEVYFGNHMNYAAAISNTLNQPPKSRKPDIDFEEETDLESKLQQLETSNNPDLFTIDNDPGDKLITIGAGPGPSFGALWFKDTRSIGGQRDFCGVGECQFGRGIRVFFTFTASGDSGEGFIFSLTNGQENSVDSVGGDIQQSELLGYSGDSRTIADPTPPPSADFLDRFGKGLQAPKIGFEFDTRVNYSSLFERNQRYCSGNNLIGDTRNDPLSSDKHAIQYVFWAKDSLSLSCRDTAGRATYDDNRHDAAGLGSSNWAKDLSGNTNSDPLIRSSDGTIYIGSAATTLFAVKPDGTEKWTFSNPTGEVFSPVLANGNIYVNSSDNRVYAVSPSNGNQIWSVPTIGPITAKPAVGSDGFVYVSSGNSLVKIDNDGTTVLLKILTPSATSPPVLNASENAFYVGLNDGRLHAIKTSDLGEVAGWPSASIGSITGSPTVDRNTGFIYVSTQNGVFKIDPTAPTDSPTQFPGPGGSNPTSSPTLSKDRSTVYVGFSNGRLYALNTSDLTLSSAFNNPNGFFPPSGSIGTSIATPEVDDNENIYFGSNNNFVYALFADGSLKWEFDTGGVVSAKPAIDQNGTVYAGSNSSGRQLWAINQFTEPRNYRQNFVNPPKPELEKNLIAYSASPEAVDPYLATSILNTNKWFKSGPWAVRIEVDREPLSGDRANYTLRTWVQQCTDTNCTNVRRTFFEDTRIRYKLPAKPPNLVQSFTLDSTLNLKFNTFLFGFTSAKKDNDDQVIVIDNFQLSFTRPGDPEILVE